MSWNWFSDGWIICVGVLSACSCALVGNYLVLRRMSLMGDAISHAVLPGLAVAFILTGSRASWAMFAGAIIVGVLTALLTEVIRRLGQVEHGASMGVVFSLLFAAGLLLIRQAADHVDLDPGCVLYGNLSQVPLEALDSGVPRAAVVLGVVMVLNIAFVVLLYKELKIAAFDPALSTTLGINASVMHYLLMIMVAITTVANFEAVGSILVIAMLIVPAATAHLLTDRLGVMLAVSLVVAVVSAVSGHVLAAFGPRFLGFDVDINTAAMIAVVTGGCLIAAVLLAPEHGVLARVGHRMALGQRILREDIMSLLYRWQELQPPGGAPLTTGEVLTAVGGGRSSRRALTTLLRRNLVDSSHTDSGPAVRLSTRGIETASALVKSHRLWETYLARHFDLPLDHLHHPAERAEHFISPVLQQELREDLIDPTHDPHGKRIPAAPPESGGAEGS